MNTYPKEWVQYLVYFHGARDYFECHEVMEAYWKNHPDSPYRQTFLALIQIAVSLYHHRRGNYLGAYKMMSSARSNIRREHLDKLGIDGQGLIKIIEHRLHAFCEDARPPFSDISIPIAAGRLLEQCRKSAEQSGFPWNGRSDLADEYLIHKHKKRDRSDVIAERQRSIADKARLRGERL